MLQKKTYHSVKYFLIFLFLSVFPLSAQDTTKSAAYKNNIPPKYNIRLNLTRPAYPLVAKFNLIQKANQGDPVSQHELGLRYLLGEGFDADTSKAVLWIGRAASKNFIPAKYNFGIMLLNGIGVRWNPFYAFRNFEYAAERKFPEAQYILGLQYLDGLVVNRNYEKGIAWIKEAARANYKPAKTTLLRLKEESYGYGAFSETEQDTINASSPFVLDYHNFSPEENYASTESSSFSDSLFAMNKKSLRQKFGITDTSFFDDESDNLKIVESAANYGSPEALYLLGGFYEAGKFVKKNKITAASYYLQAYRLGNYKSAISVLEQVLEDDFFESLKPEVDRNDPAALYVIAGLAAAGLNYQITEKQMLEFLENAALRDYIPALLELGLIYYSGELLQQDKNRALSLWKRAEDLGSREAGIRIASVEIFNQNSTFLDDEIALLKNYSGKGSALAKTVLAYCYKNGIGIEENKNEASKLFREAASHGNETAWRSLQNMYDEIRPEEEEFQIIN